MTKTPDPTEHTYETVGRGEGVTVTIENYRNNGDGTMTETQPTHGTIPDRLTWSLWFPSQPHPLDKDTT